MSLLAENPGSRSGAGAEAQRGVQCGDCWILGHLNVSLLTGGDSHTADLRDFCPPLAVTPAKARVQEASKITWIPASAGMARPRPRLKPRARDVSGSRWAHPWHHITVTFSCFCGLQTMEDRTHLPITSDLPRTYLFSFFLCVLGACPGI